MIKLYFSLKDALALAEHAVAARAHCPSWSQAENSQPAGPSLIWAKDQGTYLATNGLPTMRHDAHDPDSDVVVYAEGWGCDSDAELSLIPGIGGDDFEEHIDLTSPFASFPTLLDALRATGRAGFEWLVITAHDDLSYTLAIQR